MDVERVGLDFLEALVVPLELFLGYLCDMRGFWSSSFNLFAINAMLEVVLASTVVTRLTISAVLDINCSTP